MKIVVVLARILLGLPFLVLGLNHFFQFFEVPPPEEGAVTAFTDAMADTGYMLTLIKATEIACGALLVAGLFVPLALIVLAPVTVNILAFHLFLAPSGLPLAGVIVALQVFLAWQYRANYYAVLSPFARSAASRMHQG